MTEKYEWLVDCIIKKIKKIYGVSPPLEVIEYVVNKPVTVAIDPHVLDRFGYRLDGKDWWL